MVARSIAVIASLILVTGCAKPPPEFEDVPPADELYEEGQKILEGTRILGVWTYVNFGKAIETFQAIIDNYPYSEYAVEAEPKIADAYFSDRKMEEALSYYRDFKDLHPDHPKVPYTIYRSALCHESQLEPKDRDQTATRSALVFLDRGGGAQFGLHLAGGIGLVQFDRHRPHGRIKEGGV